MTCERDSHDSTTWEAPRVGPGPSAPFANPGTRTRAPPRCARPATARPDSAAGMVPRGARMRQAGRQAGSLYAMPAGGATRAGRRVRPVWSHLEHVVLVEGDVVVVGLGGPEGPATGEGQGRGPGGGGEWGERGGCRRRSGGTTSAARGERFTLHQPHAPACVSLRTGPRPASHVFGSPMCCATHPSTRSRRHQLHNAMSHPPYTAAAPTALYGHQPPRHLAVLLVFEHIPAPLFTLSTTTHALSCLHRIQHKPAGHNRPADPPVAALYPLAVLCAHAATHLPVPTHLPICRG